MRNKFPRFEVIAKSFSFQEYFRMIHSQHPRNTLKNFPPEWKLLSRRNYFELNKNPGKKFSTPAKKTKNLMKVHAKQRNKLIFQKNANWFSRRFFSSILIGIDEKVFPSRHFLYAIGFLLSNPKHFQSEIRKK